MNTKDMVLVTVTTKAHNHFCFYLTPESCLTVIDRMWKTGMCQDVFRLSLDAYDQDEPLGYLWEY